MSTAKMNACVYRGCNNTRKNKNNSVRFFKFPMTTPEILSQWVQHCGNEEIYVMDEALLKNRLLCEKHFNKDYIYVSGGRSMLQKTAVPKCWKEINELQGPNNSGRNVSDNEKMLRQFKNDMEVTSSKWITQGEQLRTYSRKRSQNTVPGNSDSDVEDIQFLEYCPSPCPSYGPKSQFTGCENLEANKSFMFGDTTTPSSTKSHVKKKCANLKVRLDSFKKKVRAHKMRNIRLRKKISAQASLTKLFKTKSPSVNTFINMQLPSRKKNCWKIDEKRLALSLYYKSPSCYKFFRNNLLFSLPSVRTIQSWLKVINLKAGLENTLTNKLALKVKTMSQRERVCAVLFDEIVLKPKLDYNQSHDYIEGYEDLGFLGRKNVVANTALVFYIRGIFHNWKIPLCYFTSRGSFKGDILSQLIKYVTEGLHNLEFIPKALVCDQGTNNRSAFKILGASKINPIIKINDLTIFTMFDVPHLVKSLRNNFMNPKLKFRVNGYFVSWCDILKTYELDRRSKTTRMLTKLTDVHIKPNCFQKMRVKYAVQIFSNSVAAAVRSAAQLNSFDSNTAAHTANFLETINTIFDSLNSRSLFDANPNRRPLSIKKPTSLNNLKQGLEYFKSIEVFDEKGTKRNNIYCLGGFIWTISSIRGLWEHLLDSFNCNYLITAHLNQDPLENFFSVARNRCGYNPTPSVQQFRISLQSNINIRLQKALETGNCEEDFQELLILDELSSDETKAAMESTKKLPRELTEEKFQSSPTASNPLSAISYKEFAKLTSNTKLASDVVTLETCSNVYVAGYFARKIMQKTKCDNNCEDFLVKSDADLNDDKEIFLLNKDYANLNYVSSLTVPSDEFLDLTQILIGKFSMHFETLKLQNNIFKSIYILLLNEININIIKLCPEHIEKLLKIVTKTMLYKKMKWESEKFSRKVQETKKLKKKQHRKIRILSNQ